MASESDGYNTTVVLDCGDSFRLNVQDGYPPPRVGDWWSCGVHSATYDYDPRTGEPNLERDHQAVEVLVDPTDGGESVSPESTG